MPVLPSYRCQSIDFCANHLTGFYMRATLAFNWLNTIKNVLTYFVWQSFIKDAANQSCLKKKVLPKLESY